MYYSGRQTSISSITLEGTSDPSATLTSHLNHPRYSVLNGGRRKELENITYMITLIDRILALES